MPSKEYQKNLKRRAYNQNYYEQRRNELSAGAPSSSSAVHTGAITPTSTPPHMFSVSAGEAIALAENDYSPPSTPKMPRLPSLAELFGAEEVEAEADNEEFPVGEELQHHQLRGVTQQPPPSIPKMKLRKSSDGWAVVRDQSSSLEQGRAADTLECITMPKTDRAHHLPLPETPLISEATLSRRGDGGRSLSARQIKLKTKHRQSIEQHLQRVLSAFQTRPWPLKNRNLRMKSEWTKCGLSQDGKGECACASAEQCHQNAQAFKASALYNREHMPPKINPVKLTKVTQRCKAKHACAEAGARHQVDYYSSGQFGDANCVHCGALLLPSEAESIKQGRMSQCCANGQCHTEEMAAEFAELQDPPALLKQLVESKDARLREQFLENTLSLNNTFAFASVHSKKAPAEEMGGRMDTVKYNGEFSFQFSDLVAPQGRRPIFAQVYTLQPEDALRLRTEHITEVLERNIRREILQKLEQLLRDNPFGQTFLTAAEKVAEATARNGGEIPHFQIVLLTDRDLRVDAFRDRADCTVIERADAPTANQVAVIWVQEDGLAPQINGFWLSDRAGKMRELKDGMPQLDPCCFPILFPKGTAGWRWFMKKQGRRALQQLAAIDEQLDVLQDEPTAEDEEEGQMAEDAEEDFAEDEYQLDRDDVPEQNDYEQLQQGRPVDDVIDNVNEDDLVFPPNEEGIAPRKQRQMGVRKAGPLDNISERQFYRYRLTMRENRRGAFHWLWFARRLAEYFIISALNRIERNEMDHVKAVQTKKNYRHILARDYIEALEKGAQKQGLNARLGKVFMMPQTFAGSRQYYQNKYANLMTMVRTLGNPTWFVTFTGNPKWPEVQAALQGRQEFTHRADIVCRIFMDKATEFIRDVTQRNVLGKVAGWCYSVEHQKRGMPHIHLLLILDKQGRITTPEEVDRFISARIPPLPPMDDHSPEANQQRRLWHYVTTMMLHDCNKACLQDDGFGRRECSKHFPKRYSDKTELSETRYTNYTRLRAELSDAELQAGAPDEQLLQPAVEHLLPENDPERDACEVRYQRLPCAERAADQQGRAPPQRLYEECGLSYVKKDRNGRNVMLLDDSRVIPYNAFLLLKYGTHINIEYVFGQKACKYIFKYVLKGFEKAFVRVMQPRRGAAGNGEEVFDYDEMAATFKVRYMTSMEAYMRMHSHRIVRLSHQIYPLSVHDEMGQNIVLEGHEEQGQLKIAERTRLTAFFNLCKKDPEASEMRYDCVPFRYFWHKKRREWVKRKRPFSAEASAGARMFVRVYTVSPRRQELFAIRALLLHRKGPTSFKDLRTINGREFPTFTAAAVELRLLEGNELFAAAMRDACDHIMSLTRLQHFFAMLLLHANPSNPQKLFDDFLDDMRPHRAGRDPDDQQRSMELRKGEVMCNLEYFFNCMNTSCRDIGLKGLPAHYSFAQQGNKLGEEDLLDLLWRWRGQK